MATFDVVPSKVGCGHVWCPNCGRHHALLVRDRLRQADAAYRAQGLKPVMVTLTIDHSKAHMAEPGEAFRYLRQRRAVAKCLKRWIERRCPTAAHRWFRVLELQQSGYTHFHILLYVPREFEVLRPWRGDDGRPVGGEFDAFWTYGFSNVQDDQEDVGYLSGALAYLTDDPAKCREWLQVVERANLPPKGIHVFQAAHGFWSGAGVETPPPAPEPAFSDHVNIDEDSGQLPEQVDAPAAVPVTLAERIDQCRDHSCLRVLDHDTGRTVACVPVDHRRKFLALALEDRFQDRAVYYDDSGNLYSVAALTFREIVDTVDDFGALGMRLPADAADKLADKLRTYLRDRWAYHSREHPPRTMHSSATNNGAANVETRSQSISALWL